MVTENASFKEVVEQESWKIQGQEIVLRAPAKKAIAYQLVQLYSINPMMGMCAAIVACARTKKGHHQVFKVPFNYNLNVFGMTCIEAIDEKGWSLEDIHTIGHIAASYLGADIKILNEVAVDAIEVAEDFLGSTEQKED